MFSFFQGSLRQSRSVRNNHSERQLASAHSFDSMMRGKRISIQKFFTNVHNNYQFSDEKNQKEQRRGKDDVIYGDDIVPENRTMRDAAVKRLSVFPSNAVDSGAG